MSRFRAREWARDGEEQVHEYVYQDGRSPQLWEITGWQNSRWGCRNLITLSCSATMRLALKEQEKKHLCRTYCTAHGRSIFKQTFIIINITMIKCFYLILNKVTLIWLILIVYIYNNNYTITIKFLYYTHTHIHTYLHLWFMGTLHRRNSFYTVQTVFSVALHQPNFLNFMKHHLICFFKPFWFTGTQEISS